MNAAEVIKCIAFEGTGLNLIARIAGDDGELIEQSDASTITCRVFDLADTSATVAEPAVDVSASIFNSLQVDRRWSADSVGYNFRFRLPGASRPDGDKCYRVEFWFEPSGDGEPFALAYEIESPELFSV